MPNENTTKQTANGMVKNKCCAMRDGLAGKIFMTLVGIVMVYIIVLLATMIRNNIQRFYFIGMADRQEHVISVQAEGKVTVSPDIALVTMGMISEADTVAAAQTKNTEVMNNLIAKLKELGIADEDVQTGNYNINPLYDYNQEEGRVLKGYEVTQQAVVKIRDLSKASNVVSLAGVVGANIVSGLSFEVDDAEAFKEKAGEEAIKKVLAKAEKLSNSLGVKIISVVSYNEYENGVGRYAMYDSAMGLGGGEAAPSIEPGSEDVVLTVNVTFGIK